MWNEPTPQALQQLPRLYQTEHVHLEDKIIHMHFFLGGCDWYMAEYDPKDRRFFGYVNLNNPANAEWDYTSYDELRAVNIQGFEVDRDLLLATQTCHNHASHVKGLRGLACDVVGSGCSFYYNFATVQKLPHNRLRPNDPPLCG